MSYDLMVFSPSADVITREQIVGGLAKLNWAVDFTQGYPETVLGDDEALVDGCTLFAWRANDKEAGLFKNLVGAGNIKGLFVSPRDAAGGVVAGCELSFTSPYDVTEDYEEEYLATLPRRVSQAMRETQACYHLGVGRSPFAFEFAFDLWEVIGDTVGGLMDDPQEKGQPKYVIPAHLRTQQSWWERLRSKWVR